MFLIDIQRDQVDGVRDALAARQEPVPRPARLMPVLRARVTAVRGSDVNLENYSDVRGRGSLAREYVITYRDTSRPTSRSSQGDVLDRPAGAAGGRRAGSVDRAEHPRALQHQRRRQMRFDVLGRTIDARVTSIRHVEWEDSRSGGFMFVFRPGALDRAPHTFIGFVKGAGRPGRARAASARSGLRASRTSPRSTAARSSRESRRSSTTPCSRSRSSAASRCSAAC